MRSKFQKRLGRLQSFVAKYENGERRRDVVELIAIARILSVIRPEIVSKVAENRLTLAPFESPRIMG